jgi:hypothetical protein
MNLQYPRLVYTSPGPVECNGGTYGAEVVKDDEELKAALEVGFFMSIPEAIKGEADALTVVASIPEDQKSDAPLATPTLPGDAAQMGGTPKFKVD